MEFNVWYAGLQVFGGGVMGYALSRAGWKLSDIGWFMFGAALLAISPSFT